MDFLLIESAAVAAAAVASAGGSRVLWVRNRRDHQQNAVDARLAAATASEAFVRAWEEARLLVPALLDRLGPQDSAAPGARADTTLSKAQAVYDAYGILLASDSPTDKHPRRVYIRLTQQYGRQETRFRQSQQELVNLVAQFKQLTAEADSVHETHAAAMDVMSTAQTALAARTEEGWLVTSLENTLNDASSLFRQAEGAMAALELLTARREFEQVRLQAATVANSARELPRRLRSLDQKANMFSLQHAALKYDFERAEAGIATVQGVYAEAVLAGARAGLAAASVRHSHMERLIAELRELNNPALDAWDRAEMIVVRLAEIVEEVTTACHGAIRLRITLDKAMDEVRQNAAKLRSDITELSMESRDRDGHQRAIRKALKRLDAEVVELLRRMDDPMPHPHRFNTRYAELAGLLEQLEKASERLGEEDYYDEDDDEDGFLPAGIMAAAAAIGITVLDD